RHQAQRRHRATRSPDLRSAASRQRLGRAARKKELKSPGGLTKRDDPLFVAVIDRCRIELNGQMGSTKDSCLRKVADSKLAKLKCSEVTSDRLVEFAKSLDVLPQTRSNYLSHLSPIF